MKYDYVDWHCPICGVNMTGSKRHHCNPDTLRRREAAISNIGTRPMEYHRKLEIGFAMLAGEEVDLP
jgi:hypothetical protein